MAPSQSPNARKVRRHREKLRAQGLRPIQIWVPDVNDPKVVEQLREEARVIAQSPQEKEDLAFIDSLWESLCEEGFFDK